MYEILVTRNPYQRPHKMKLLYLAGAHHYKSYVVTYKNNYKAESKSKRVSNLVHVIPA